MTVQTEEIDMVMAVPGTYYHTSPPSHSHRRHTHTCTTTNEQEGVGHKSVGSRDGEEVHVVTVNCSSVTVHKEVKLYKRTVSSATMQGSYSKAIYKFMNLLLTFIPFSRHYKYK